MSTDIEKQFIKARIALLGVKDVLYVHGTDEQVEYIRNVMDNLAYIKQMVVNNPEVQREQTKEVE